MTCILAVAFGEHRNHLDVFFGLAAPRCSFPLENSEVPFNRPRPRFPRLFFKKEPLPLRTTPARNLSAIGFLALIEAFAALLVRRGDKNEIAAAVRRLQVGDALLKTRGHGHARRQRGLRVRIGAERRVRLVPALFTNLAAVIAKLPLGIERHAVLAVTGFALAPAALPRWLGRILRFIHRRVRERAILLAVNFLAACSPP